MINRYAGEIHINPIRTLRNDDFNNDGHIKDIEATLKEAIELNQQINDRLQKLKAWLDKGTVSGTVQFHFADSGYISIKGLSDDQLKQLASKGLIELFDYATDRDWVKRHGMLFGLIWEGGRAVQL
jgi:hypothetical protein